VKQVAHSLFVLVALVAIFDGSTTITGCIFSGLGRPVIGTIVQFLSNYVTALPIGIITSFVLSWGNGLFGFWWGSLSTYTRNNNHNNNHMIKMIKMMLMLKFFGYVVTCTLYKCRSQ
jgi:hypothetical protein